MELPKRKNTRLENYNYSQNGVYYITICTDKRNPLFSKVVGALHEAPELKLTEYGRITEKHIHDLASRFAISVDRYVIMPDHVHLLIRMDGRALREAPLRARTRLSEAIGYLKMNVSRDMHNCGFEGNVWQRSYYDHVIRDQADYNDICEYIPKKLLLK